MRSCLHSVLFCVAVFGLWSFAEPDLDDLLSPFLDLNHLSDDLEQVLELLPLAFKDDGDIEQQRLQNSNYFAQAEMHALVQLYQECATAESNALKTWCVGNESSYPVDLEKSMLCPRKRWTHPCGDQLLNYTKDSNTSGFWQGIQCTLHTDPVTITHIYLPSQHLECNLSSVNLGMMQSLQSLDLSGNSITGEIPVWIQEMSSLRILRLSGNYLVGDIPIELGSNHQLETLDLSNNQLQASSLGILRTLPQLQIIDLANNRIAASFDGNDILSRRVSYLNLSRNRITGSLTNLPSFSEIVVFDVSHNELHGNLSTNMRTWGLLDPDDPSFYSSLQIINVSGNALAGPIPDLSLQTSLRVFDLTSNSFTGKVPMLPHMNRSELHIDHNLFTCQVEARNRRLTQSCICTSNHTFVLLDMQQWTVRSVDTKNWKAGSLIVDDRHKFQACPTHRNVTSFIKEYCDSCPPGYFYDESREPSASHVNYSFCEPCASGTYSMTTGFESCSYCPRGTSTEGMIGQRACLLCSPGTYSPILGQSTCQLCPHGYFTGKHGQGKCQPCWPGTFSDVLGAAECFQCPPGQHQNHSDADHCDLCEEGSVAPMEGSTKCTSCPRGTFHDSAKQSCLKCPQNKIAEEPGQLDCKTCLDGYMAMEYEYGYRCVPKNLTTGVETKRGSTTKSLYQPCRPGTYNNGGTKCQRCPKGSFAANSGSFECQQCPKGTFANSRGSVVCSDAQPGFYVNVRGAHYPTLCPQNTFTNKNRSTTCMQCLYPKYRTWPGGKKCDIIKDGQIIKYIDWPLLTFQVKGIDMDRGLKRTLVENIVKAVKDILAGYTFDQPIVHFISNLRDDNEINVTLALEPQSLKMPDEHNIKRPFESIKRLFEPDDTIKDESSSPEDWTGTVIALPSATSIPTALQFVRTKKFIRLLILVLEAYHDKKVEPQPITQFTIRVMSENDRLKSLQAVACPAGSYYYVADSANRSSARCLDCPLGTYNSEEQSLVCKSCPKDTFGDKEGLTTCKKCPFGSASQNGAISCTVCTFLSTECRDFYEDLFLTFLAGMLLLVVALKRLRRFVNTNPNDNDRTECAALMTQVRSVGRVYAGSEESS